MTPAPRRLLLVGSSPDALEAKRVILERAGYVVAVRTKAASVRKAAEQMGASLVIMDSSAGGGLRAALDEMSRGARGAGGEGASAIPVLVIGTGEILKDFAGPGAALARPAQKRSLLESTRALVTGYHEGEKRRWSRRSRS